MKRKMFSIVTSSALLLQGMSFSALATELKFEPMEEIEILSETQNDSNEADEANLVIKGTIGNSDVTWEVDENGTLIIGEGTFFNDNGDFSWPWKDCRNKIHAVDGSKAFKIVGYCNSAFNDLTEVTDIDLSGWDISEVTSIVGLFFNCKNLKTITFSSNWDTSNIKDMAFVFIQCAELKTLDLSNWNTSKVENMDALFMRCSNLTSMGIENWDTSNVVNMGNMFSECSSLKTLDLSQWDTSKVGSMYNLFESCTNLTNLTLTPHWVSNSVGSLVGMFYRCSSLKTLDTSQWDTSNVIRMSSTFNDCTALTQIDVSQWDTSKVTDMQGLFASCSNLKSLDVTDWKTGQVTNMNYMFYGDSKLESLPVDRWDTSNVIDMSRMFEDCKNLKSLNLSRWKTTNVKNMDAMFHECRNLKSLNVSNWDTSSVSDMGAIFRWCESLEELDLSSWNSVQNTDTYDIFGACTSLKKIQYNQNCESLISLLPKEWEWYQNDQGPYITAKIPSLSLDEVATLIRFEGMVNPPVEDEDNDDFDSSEDNTNSTSPKEDDSTLDRDGDPKPTPPGGSNNTKPKPFTPTPTDEDSCSITVNLSIHNNESLSTLGIKTENGSLPENEVEILEGLLNKTPHYNPNDYSVSLLDASVTQNEHNGKYDFDLTVTVTLKDESRINLVLNKLQKKIKPQIALVNESGFLTLDLEGAESSSSYKIIELEDKIIIEGIVVSDVFKDNEIDSQAIKNILDQNDYEVSDLDFSSVQNKKSHFSLDDLTSLVTIEVNTALEEDNPRYVAPSRKPKPSTPAAPSAHVVKKPIYRFFNKLTGAHFFTTNEAERDQLLGDKNWNSEEQGWITPEVSDFPIYRLCNPNTGEHHYTMDKNEYDTLHTYGWQPEGIGLYSADSKDANVIQLHRLYNPNSQNAGTHHYTADENEKNVLISQGWNYEGIAWHGLKS